MNRHEEFIKKLRKKYYKGIMTDTWIKNKQQDTEPKITEADLAAMFEQLYKDSE